MKLLKVNEMHCENCVKRISNALKKEEIAFKISLEKKTLELENSELILKVTEVLDDLGFSIEEIL